MRTHQLQRGITMTEALVALVVLAVGMLGIASLFIETLRANRSASSRMHAVNLVNDMTDRILANRLAGNAYALVPKMEPNKQACVDDDGSNNNCTIEELATDDMARWVESVRAVMPASPNGDPPVTMIDVTEGVTPDEPWSYRVVVRWTEPGEERPFSYGNTLVVTPGIEPPEAP